MMEVCTERNETSEAVKRIHKPSGILRNKQDRSQYGKKKLPIRLKYESKVHHIREKNGNININREKTCLNWPSVTTIHFRKIYKIPLEIGCR